MLKADHAIGKDLTLPQNSHWSFGTCCIRYAVGGSVVLKSVYGAWNGEPCDVRFVCTPIYKWISSQPKCELSLDAEILAGKDLKTFGISNCELARFISSTWPSLQKKHASKWGVTSWVSKEHWFNIGAKGLFNQVQYSKIGKSVV